MNLSQPRRRSAPSVRTAPFRTGTHLGLQHGDRALLCRSLVAHEFWRCQREPRSPVRGFRGGESALLCAAFAPPSPALRSLFPGSTKGAEREGQPDPEGRESHGAHPSDSPPALAEAAQIQTTTEKPSPTQYTVTADAAGPQPGQSDAGRHSPTPWHRNHHGDRYTHACCVLTPDLPHLHKYRQTVRPAAGPGASGSRSSEARTQDGQTKTSLQADAMPADVSGVAPSPPDPHRPAQPWSSAQSQFTRV